MFLHTEAHRPRRFWIYLTIVVVVVVAVAGAVYAALAVRLSAIRSDAVASVAAEPSPEPSGCLGGAAYTAQSVVAAQHLAPDTTAGAVEVAGAFYRWLDQFPYPSAAQSKLIEQSVVAASAPKSWHDLSAVFGDSTYQPAKGAVTNGRPYVISLSNSAWRTTSASDGMIAVDMGSSYVVDQRVVPGKAGAIGLWMTWQDGAWHVVGGHSVDQQQLAATSHRFAVGC